MDKKSRNPKNRRSPPDFRPLPQDDFALVPVAQQRGVTGGKSEQTLRNWQSLGIWPKFVDYGPN